MSALLEAITLGQALGAAGGLSVAGVGIGWIVKQNKRIDGKAEQAAFDALRESQRERCASCRKELDAALDRKASKAEVIAHGNDIAALARAQAVAEANAKATSDKLDDLKETMHGIAEKLERLLERGAP